MYMLGAIVLTDFITAITDVTTAVAAAIGDVATAALGIAGLIIGGLILFRLFKRMIAA